MKYPVAKILIVEEDFAIALSIKSILKKHGHEILKIVTTGEDAVISALRNKPDIALMDLNTKGKINSLQAGRILIQNEVPVIFINTHDENEAEKKSTGKNYKYYIKPYDEIIMEQKAELILDN